MCLIVGQKPSNDDLIVYAMGGGVITMSSKEGYAKILAHLQESLFTNDLKRSPKPKLAAMLLRFLACASISRLEVKSVGVVILTIG